METIQEGALPTHVKEIDQNKTVVERLVYLDPAEDFLAETVADLPTLRVIVS